VFGGPVVAGAYGWQTVFRGTSLVLLVWALVFATLAGNPPRTVRPAGMSAMVRVLRRSPVAWLLGAFYFLTFGGFVAFSIYLPTLLRAQFGLTPADAGFRAAGFVVLATAMRPIGGWLADRIGGAQVLSWVFAGIAVFALLLAWPAMIPFTVGALACATLMGLGNDAVFKLVPERFPTETGTVTGLVGALALHHDLPVFVQLGHSEGTGDDAITARDAPGLARRLHDAVRQPGIDCGGRPRAARIGLDGDAAATAVGAKRLAQRIQSKFTCHRGLALLPDRHVLVGDRDLA